jgi:aryl-alcohol dehydrogenase-like predicted oxidoreductase
MYVATKVPPKNYLWPARPGIAIEEVFPYSYVMECAEHSLKSLDLDTIDLLQLHVWNPEWIKSGEWQLAAAELKKSGKIRAFGISINDHQPDSALEVIKTGLIDTVQVIYNIFEQSPETSLFPLCLEHDIGVIARVPLDEGALSGTIREDTEFDPNDFRASYFYGDRKKAVAEHVKQLQDDLTAAGNVWSLPEIALRFCISHPAVSSVIPGMRKPQHARFNCALSEKGAVHPEVLTVLKKHVWSKMY